MTENEASSSGNGNGGRYPFLHRLADHFEIPYREFCDLCRRMILRSVDNCTQAEVIWFMRVSQSKGLDPFVGEIIPMRKGADKPMTFYVPVDAWLRKAHENKHFAGIEYEYPPDDVEQVEGGPAWVDCIIHRAGWDRPVRIREWMRECYIQRKYPGPWQSHPSRMLRHRATIQCIRVALGISLDMPEEMGVVYGENGDDVRTAQGALEAPPEAIDLPPAETAEKVLTVHDLVLDEDGPQGGADEAAAESGDLGEGRGDGAPEDPPGGSDYEPDPELPDDFDPRNFDRRKRRDVITAISLLRDHAPGHRLDKAVEESGVQVRGVLSDLKLADLNRLLDAILKRD